MIYTISKNVQIYENYVNNQSFSVDFFFNKRLCVVGVNSEQWTESSEQRAVNREQWAVNSWQWRESGEQLAVKRERWTESGEQKVVNK